MAFRERVGATSDSLRIKNNEWFIARSVTELSDIKIFRVNTNDEIEFFGIPNVGGDSFVLNSQFQDLEDRVSLLEALISSITAGNINIHAKTLTALDISSQSIVLPHSPISNSVVIIPANGIPQLQGTDFSVSSNTISWNLWPYAEIAAEGEAIKILYLF